MAFLLCMWVCALRLQEASVIFKLNHKLQFHHELSEASLWCSVWIFVHQQKATNERSFSSGSVITLFFSPSYWTADWNNHNNIKLMGQLWLIFMVIKSNAVLHPACIKSNKKKCFQQHNDYFNAVFTAMAWWQGCCCCCWAFVATFVMCQLVSLFFSSVSVKWQIIEVTILHLEVVIRAAPNHYFSSINLTIIFYQLF